MTLSGGTQTAHGDLKDASFSCHLHCLRAPPTGQAQLEGRQEPADGVQRPALGPRSRVEEGGGWDWMEKCRRSGTMQGPDPWATGPWRTLQHRMLRAAGNSPLSVAVWRPLRGSSPLQPALQPARWVCTGCVAGGAPWGSRLPAGRDCRTQSPPALPQPHRGMDGPGQVASGMGDAEAI